MARDLISNLSDWNLVYDEQDIRGRDAFSEDGLRLGTVQDLIADTDAEAIVAIVLDNGQEYPADLIDIEKDRVRVHASGMRRTGAAAAVPVVAVVVSDPAPTSAFSGTDAAFSGAPTSAFSGTDAAYAGAAAAGTAGAYAWTDHDRDFFGTRRMKRQQGLGAEQVAGVLQQEQQELDAHAQKAGLSGFSKILDRDGDGSIADELAQLGAVVGGAYLASRMSNRGA